MAGTDKFEHGAFLESLGSTFYLPAGGSEKVELELFEVSELKAARLQQMFSIVFRCRSGSVFPQRTYRLEHEKMGQLDLLLVPIQKDDQWVYYEAVFNLLLKDSESSGAAA